MNAAKWRCEECKAEHKTLEVHHVYYIAGKDPWEYPECLLMCLCSDCHESRAQIEQTIFVNVADVLRDKSIAELKEQPIWTMFDGGQAA
jgi:hypothetical protein